MDSHAMGFYIRMHDYNSLNLINITQNLLHGTTSSKAKSRSRNPLWFYVPDSLCWKKHTLHFQTLTVGLNELLNSRSHMRNKTEIKLYWFQWYFRKYLITKNWKQCDILNTIALIYTLDFSWNLWSSNIRKPRIYQVTNSRI